MSSAFVFPELLHAMLVVALAREEAVAAAAGIDEEAGLERELRRRSSSRGTVKESLVWLQKQIDCEVFGGISIREGERDKWTIMIMIKQIKRR